MAEYVVKWGKNTYNIPVKPSLSELKDTIYALTLVPQDRQKLLAKGKTLDSDDKLAALPPKTPIMCIGSAKTLDILDESSMNSGSSSLSLSLQPMKPDHGLDNLGNTCWLNSSIKLLYQIKELRDALVLYAQASVDTFKALVIKSKNGKNNNINNPSPYYGPSEAEIGFTRCLGNVMCNLDDKECQFNLETSLKTLLMAISEIYPHLFSLKEQRHEQQDADEFLTCALSTIQRTLSYGYDGNGIKLSYLDSDKYNLNDLITYLLCIKVSTLTALPQWNIKQYGLEYNKQFDDDDDDDDVSGKTKKDTSTPDNVDSKTADMNESKENTTKSMKDDNESELETGEKSSDSTKTTTDTKNNKDDYKKELPVKTTEIWNKLRGTVNQDINDVYTAIKTSLTETITKKSSITGIDETYDRVSYIDSMPQYIIVQLQRFQWLGHTQSKAKLIRKVSINETIDIFSLLTPDLQAKIQPLRQTYSKLQNEINNIDKQGTTTTTDATTTDIKETKNDKKDDQDAMSDKTDTKDTSNDTTTTSKPDTSHGAGYYSLCSVITHQGRDADSGHYIGWTKGRDVTPDTKASLAKKNDPIPPNWLKHDDDKITPVTDNDIQGLCGGGDFHTAYILLYKLKKD